MLADYLKYSEAEVNYQKAYQADPSNIEAHEKRAAALDKIGRTEDSKQERQKAQDLRFK
jgi:Flp pilus assembly protein TadD